MSEEFKNNSNANDGPVCPKCGSAAVSAQKKGYGAGKGCCGAILIGPLGLLCGATGANKMEIYCMKCGHKWKP